MQTSFFFLPKEAHRHGNKCYQVSLTSSQPGLATVADQKTPVRLICTLNRFESSIWSILIIYGKRRLLKELFELKVKVRRVESTQ